jgi:hypothetical protein
MGTNEAEKQGRDKNASAAAATQQQHDDVSIQKRIFFYVCAFSRE